MISLGLITFIFVSHFSISLLSFAENIVNCLKRPLQGACPVHVVDTMVTALHRFLPPACAPIPAVREWTDEQGHEHVDKILFETVIVEGGEGDAN